MRIAILGTRGVPASYGGFETFAEQLSTRLVARFDAALICNAANAPFVPILRAAGTPVAINVDGLEHKRRKWNWLGKNYYRVAERLAVWLPNETVTDARVIQDYYLAKYRAGSTMIAYGAEVERRPDRAAVRAWGVEPNRYVLYVSRLEPENNAAMVIEAFRRVRTTHKLLIVGDAPYAHDYISRLKELARRDRRIVFTGFVFGDAYRALQQNAFCYVHATEVGGTHPALLEAMGYGNCVLTLATPENVEVVGDAGVTYSDEFDLAEKLQRVLRDGSLVHA